MRLQKLCSALVLSLLFAPAAAAVSQGEALSLERIFADPPLEGTAPTGLKISPGGAWLTFLKGSAEDSEVMDLWAMPLSGGEAVPLVRARDVLGTTEEKLSEAERMARERKRIRHRGIATYSWCGKDDRALLFPLSGDLYHVRLPEKQGGKPEVVRLTSDDEPELDPRCSASGALVAFVKKGDLHVVDGKGRARRLTRGGSETRTFGLAEFIAMEEMGRYEGYAWAPDERRLLVFEVDESPVSVKVRPKIFADRTELFSQRYPAAGEKNALVRLHVVDAKTGRLARVQLPEEDGYIARAAFADADTVLVQWQSRDQKRLVLLEAKAPAWKPRTILEERDDRWVELHDDLHVLKDGRLLWTSERTGARQVYVVDRKTGEARMLPALEEPVREVVGVDEEAGLVYVTAGADRGRQQHVFALELAAAAEPAGRKPRRLTADPGTHSAVFDDSGRYFIDRHSRFGVPPRVSLRRADGSLVQVIDGNPAPELQRLKRPAPRSIEVRAEDGTALNALLLPPVDQQKGRKYPIVVYTYGGPHGQVVFDGWSRHYPFFVWLAQNGYGVFLVDNRGMGGRDRAFSRAIHKRFGDVEIVDLFRAVDELKRQEPWVDGARIGVWGWSYGGFLSARAVLDEKTPFAAAAAIAPVTEWRLYDTHYTERYLGMPTDADRAYERASLLPRAKLLKKPLLLVHGTADDNVLFENTLQLVEALQQDSLPFELMVYPGRAHGLAGRATGLHVYKTLAGFFERTLKR